MYHSIWLCWQESGYLERCKQNDVSLFSFDTAIGAPVRITNAIISILYIVSNGSVKIFLKTNVRRTSKHRKIVLLAISKFNSIKSNIKSTGRSWY